MKSTDSANLLRAFKATGEKVATNIEREKYCKKRFGESLEQEQREPEDLSGNFHNAEAVYYRGT